MKRTPFYSHSGRLRKRSDSLLSGHDPDSEKETDLGTDEGISGSIRNRLSGAWRTFSERHERLLLVLTGAAASLLVLLIYSFLTPGQNELTQHDIDMAVLYTMDNLRSPPSIESVAYEVIRPSIVRVRRMTSDEDEELSTERSVGTGVVIEENGTILTNLHVVTGSDRIMVVFADGTESPADVIGIQPENDLAVIRAQLLPDDLLPATLRSTSGLREGDRVIAVGYPFGIGPSVTSGVISGLNREFVAIDEGVVLTNLIQFDAAANPGNSGGPLVTKEGDVVGIVTAILNHTDQRVFIGIGFAVPIEDATESMGMSPF